MTQQEELPKTIGSINQRLGCAYCFYTLDPNDDQADWRKFVACTRCRAAYHSNCQRHSCTECGAAQFEQVEVVPPPPLNTQVRRPMAIKPVQISLAEERVTWDYVIDNARRELLIHIPLALLFIAIAGLVGSFAYRISQLSPITAQAILDVVLRTNPPPARVISMSLLSAATFTYVFYPSLALRDNSLSGGQRFFRFVGCIMFLVACNLLVMNLRLDTVLRSSSLLFNTPLYREVFAGEVAAFVIIFLLAFVAFVYRARTRPIVRPPELPRHAMAIENFIDTLRFLTAIACTILLSMLVARLHSATAYSNITINILEHEFMAKDQILVLASTCTAVALAIYHPPIQRVAYIRSRTVSRINLLIRIVGIVTCLAVFGLLYRSVYDTRGVIETAQAALIAGVLLMPVQRAFS